MAEAELLRNLFKVVAEHLNVLLVVRDPESAKVLYQVLLP
jgi:polysaccharide pyruvyl transferase WcaK-like protein